MNAPYPPYDYLCQAADHCPEAVAAYLMLWRDQDNEYMCKYTKEMITNDFSLGWRKYLNDLRALAREGLIEWLLSDDGLVTIVMAQPEIDAEGCTLC